MVSSVALSLTPDPPDEDDMVSPDSKSPPPLISSSAPAAIPSIEAPSFAQRFKNSLRNLRKISSPTCEIDGIPVVLAPDSVVLQASEAWKDHIIAHFHGRCPSPSKIYDDLNPVWEAYDPPVRGMEEFRIFLDSNDLIDLNCRGTFYTWNNSRPEDPILRKLDRALVNPVWLHQFPESLAIFDPPGDSDHSPCLVSLSPSEHSGRKSFKYFSFVSTHSEFLPRFQASWSQSVGTGSKLFLLGQRLKLAKECCRSLNREGFGNIQQRTKDALVELERIQNALLTVPTPDLVTEESQAREVWSFFASAQENFFKLKSRIRWLKEGDSNTRFFHRAVMNRQSWNAIRYLRNSSGLRIFNQEQIKGMTVAYFKNLLGSDNRGIEPMLVDQIRLLHPFRCSDSLASELTRLPTDEEIKEVFFKLPKSKAPGPDGFSVEFFLDAWEVVGVDSIQAVKEFFSSGRMLRKFNATTIALLPKMT
ncbi:PREDICTED: uncharacterized protein LOC106297779 [Brassica oleracea var. oleracea]|uniref:uncharacterized protein LOC106297779 n=1 Tax=Brassica oleracea var. oleracea TaxID=109376 RepID=UPI0006A74ECB|nr:PREDICTED: uncharacterized protein LOC106297779 [Brassica oleracea var. oleracea]